VLVLDNKKQKSDNSFSNNTNHSNQIKMQTRKKNDKNLSEETSGKKKITSLLKYMSFMWKWKME
jgi:hypothetical protein